MRITVHFELTLSVHENSQEMPRSQSVIISLPEGQRLADLSGIAHDLRSCQDNIALYAELSTTKLSLRKHELMDCVMTTIIIRYGRCFGQSVRGVTQKELEAQLGPADLDVHKMIIALRNKHYAHSENSCELAQINVWLTTDSPEKEATNVSVGTRYVSGGDPIILNNLSVLLSKLLNWAIDEEKKESIRLLPVVLKKYSLEALYDLIGKTPQYEVTIGDLSKKRPGV